MGTESRLSDQIRARMEKARLAKAFSEMVTHVCDATIATLVVTVRLPGTERGQGGETATFETLAYSVVGQEFHEIANASRGMILERHFAGVDKTTLESKERMLAYVEGVAAGAPEPGDEGPPPDEKPS